MKFTRLMHFRPAALDVALVTAWAPAVAGALALLSALMLGAVLAPRWQAQAQAQEQATQSDRRAAAAVAVAAAAAVTAPSNRPVGSRQAMWADWPGAERTPERSAALLQLARRHGLTVQRAREQADPAGHFQLGLSGQASYPALRSFVAAALAADPALVLDRLRLQRAAPAVAELDVDMQWTLLQRAAGPDAAAAAAAAAAVVPHTQQVAAAIGGAR